MERVRYVTRQTGPALFVISSYWAALTLGWLALLRAGKSDDREGYLISCAVWCVALSPVVGLVVYFGGLAAIGLGLLAWTWPLAHLAVELRCRPKPCRSTPAPWRA